MADLVAVDGNPLKDITATHRVVAVWQGGRRLDLARLRREARRAIQAAPKAGDTVNPPWGLLAGKTR